MKSLVSRILLASALLLVLLDQSYASVEPSTDFDFVGAMYDPWEVDELGNFS